MDAILIVSFGGPEGPDEVMPFLRHVTAGRNVPDERLAEVAEHYLQRGGVSPINAQTADLVAALRDELGEPGPPVYWGNRNSRPWLADAVAEMAADGVDRAVAVFTSAYSSYSGCRQYRENLAAAGQQVRERGLTPPDFVKVPAFYNDPGFAAASLERLSGALAGVPDGTHVLFSTHSIPVVMQEQSGPQGFAYTRQHLDLAEFLMAGVAQLTGREFPWELVFQSRSGPPHIPWLEPDVNDRIRQLAAAGVRSVVVDPIGFISDHMEVVHDLDTEAAETAADVGLEFVRVPTVGTHPAFVAGLTALARGALADEPCPVAFGEAAPAPCRHGCCPNPRAERPAVCEEPA